MPLSPLGLDAKLNMARVSNESHRLAVCMRHAEHKFWNQMHEKYSLFIINFGIYSIVIR